MKGSVDLVKHTENGENVIPFPVSSKQKKSYSLILKRVLAFSVDIYLIGIIRFSFILTYTTFVKSYYYQLTVRQQQELLSSLGVVDLFSGLTLFWSYFTLSYVLGNGRTIGKMIFKIALIQNRYINDSEFTEALPTLKQSIQRTFGYFVCYLSAGTLFLIPFLRKDRKGLADFFSSTSVVTDDEFYRLFIRKTSMLKLVRPPKTDENNDNSRLAA